MKKNEENIEKKEGKNEKKGCNLCGQVLVTKEEKALNWCQRHLDEFDSMSMR